MSTSILLFIQNQIRFPGYLTLLILGNIGNLFAIIIFSRYRRTACSVYLLTLSIINNLYLTFNSLMELFPLTYDEQISYTIFLCKMRFYLSNVLGQIAKTLLILACIDRFMFTSNQANVRSLSTIKRAKFFIYFSIIFWLLFASHIAVMITVVNKRCRPSDIYLVIYAFYTAIFIGLIPPILLGIFGYLTYVNMKLMRRTRIQLIYNSIRRRERSLIVIVISEVFVYVLTTIPYVLSVLETMITDYIFPKKNFQYVQIEVFIFTLAFLFLFSNNVASFYIYLIVSKSFRRDFKELIKNCFITFQRQPTVRTTSVENPMTEQCETTF